MFSEFTKNRKPKITCIKSIKAKILNLKPFFGSFLTVKVIQEKQMN